MSGSDDGGSADGPASALALADGAGAAGGSGGASASFFCFRPDDELLRRVGLVCCRGEEAGEDDCERSARARGENIARRRRMLRTFS